MCIASLGASCVCSIAEAQALPRMALLYMDCYDEVVATTLLGVPNS